MLPLLIHFLKWLWIPQWVRPAWIYSNMMLALGPMFGVFLIALAINLVDTESEKTAQDNTQFNIFALLSGFAFILLGAYAVFFWVGFLLWQIQRAFRKGHKHLFLKMWITAKKN